jgi:hypothetical protein
VTTEAGFLAAASEAPTTTSASRRVPVMHRSSPTSRLSGCVCSRWQRASDADRHRQQWDLCTAPGMGACTGASQRTATARSGYRTRLRTANR